MPADPAAAHSDERSRYCLSLARHRAASGECGCVVRICRRHGPNISSTSAIRHRARAWFCDRTRSLASPISLLRVIVIAIGAES